MREKGIYLHEADEYVGPFSSRRDARRFMALMKLFGTDADGIEIVELDLQAKDRLNGAYRSDSVTFYAARKIALSRSLHETRKPA